MHFILSSKAATLTTQVDWPDLVALAMGAPGCTVRVGWTPPKASTGTPSTLAVTL